MATDMKNIEFKRFTDPDIFGAIRVKHLAQFFDQFNVLTRNLPVRGMHDVPGSESYSIAWIKLL